jgi:hypothetical protein
LGKKINGNNYKIINQHESYTILNLGPCVEWEIYIRSFSQQLNELILRNNRKHSWNTRAKFVVPVMSNCTQFENKYMSKDSGTPVEI